MPADTVEVIVKLSGLATVQAGMRHFRDAVTAPLEAAASRVRNSGGSIALGVRTAPTPQTFRPLLPFASLIRFGPRANIR